MNNSPSVTTDLNFLVADVANARSKPHLAPTLSVSLQSMGHDVQEIQEALNAFFAAGTASSDIHEANIARTIQ